MCSIAGPALELQPGALPLLESFSWDAPAPTQLELPASWGHAGAWPMLRTLHFEAPLAGTLPAAWADGFRCLESLSLAEPEVTPAGLPSHGDAVDATDWRHKRWQVGIDLCELLPSRQPPPEWGRGFPALRELTLSSLCLAGPIPGTWLNGTAFRHVTHL